MRNTWKGMLLGAIGGAAIGLALESIDRAARGAKQGANTAAHATSDVAARTGGRAKQRAFTLVHEGAEYAARAAKRAAERNGVHALK
jgi:hypothetical protein